MCHLDCPQGVPLYTIPAAFLGDAAWRQDTLLLARGLELLWVKSNNQGFQNVLDLQQPFRCKDEWWNSLLDEFRFLQLTPDTHAFLRGQETTVPGSWLAGKVSCKNPKCGKLSTEWQKLKIDWSAKEEMECDICKQE